MKLILKNSNLVFQKEAEPEWTEVNGDPKYYGFAAFGKQFSNGDVIKVKVEVVSPAELHEPGAPLKYTLGVCTEEQATTVHTPSKFISTTGFYVSNTAGAVSAVNTFTISLLTAEMPYVCATSIGAVHTQKPITVKWYYYKVK